MTLNASEISGMRDTITGSLPDTCTITRETAQGTYNHATLKHAAPTVSTIYTGVCHVTAIPATRAPEVVVGEENTVLVHFMATLPFTASGVDANDFLVVTAATDDDMVGEEFRIVNVEMGSWALCTRLLLQKRQPFK